MHRLLTDHSCTSVQAQGWGGIKNGELLRLAETDFDLFITAIFLTSWEDLLEFVHPRSNTTCQSYLHKCCLL